MTQLNLFEDTVDKIEVFFDKDRKKDEQKQKEENESDVKRPTLKGE